MADNQDGPIESEFWCVWGGHKERPPTVRQFQTGDAMAEAMRLAQLQPGQTFYVLKAVKAYRAEIEIKSVFLDGAGGMTEGKR